MAEPTEESEMYAEQRAREAQRFLDSDIHNVRRDYHDAACVFATDVLSLAARVTALQQERDEAQAANRTLIEYAITHGVHFPEERDDMLTGFCRWSCVTCRVLVAVGDPEIVVRHTHLRPLLSVPGQPATEEAE